MARVVVLAAMVALAACAGPSLERIRLDAEAALARGQLAEAERLIAAGAAKADGQPVSIDRWRFRLLSAEVQLARLDLDDAAATLDEVPPEEAALESMHGRRHWLLAKLHVLRGEVKDAIGALETARARTGGDRSLGFDVDVLASQLQFMSGRWSEAEQGLHALIAAAAAAGDRVHQAQALNNMGMGYLVRGRADEALPWFERVIALDELDHTTIVGQALNNAGISYARLGQFERAIDYQQKAIEIHKGGRQLDYAQALGELGSTYFVQGDAGRGLPVVQEALRIATEAGLSSEAVLWARNLAGVYAQAGDWDAAERYNEEASRLAPSQSGSRRAYALVTSAVIAAGRGRTEEARALYGQALTAAEDVPAVRWMSHEGLANLAAATGNAAEASRQFELALQTVEQTRSALLRADYRISFASRLITFYRSYVEFLMDQGRVERALEVADASRARVLAERQGVAPAAGRVSAAALKRLAAQTRTTLLFYWLGPEQSWVWRVTGAEITAVPLPTAQEVESLVAAHQEAIHNTLVDPLAAADAPGATLWNALVAPVAGSLASGAPVVIVPDGALHRVNFETLPAAGDVPHYWIEDVTVQVAPSLAMLQRVPGRVRAGAGTSGAAAPAMLLIGNPTPREPEFPALSYATAEMEGIQRHFPATAVVRIEGADASPGAFSSAQPGRFPMIHFTSHAVANIESPLDSAVILSGPEQAYKLYARDVANAQLQAELVTVSACRSAGERAYAGEGLVGFAWAFLRAGSKRVVAGLWDVDDRSTATLMTEMYRRIADGEAPASALRAAKLELMRQGAAKPYYWGPLQVFTMAL